LINCSASLAANYRAARRARSRAEFISKLDTVVEESDERSCLLARIHCPDRDDV